MDTRQRPDREPRTTHTTLTATIRSDKGIGTVYSPSHTVQTERRNSRQAVVRYEHEGDRDGRDFVLYVTRDNAEVGATLLSHRPYSDRAGYFMLMLSPNAERGAETIQPRDIVFVLDTSGSMAGDKMTQARDALRYCVQRLGARRISGHRNDILDHHVAHPRRHVGEVNRSRLFEAIENRVDSGVGVSTPRRDVAGLPLSLFEGRISNGRADGVGVGIAVPDDVGVWRGGGGGHESLD